MKKKKIKRFSEGHSDRFAKSKYEAVFENKAYKNYIDKVIIFPKNASVIFQKDPKYFTFLFSRYKFVSKMINQNSIVAEFGSGEGFGSPIVSANAKRLDLYDFFMPSYLEGKKFIKNFANISFYFQDILSLRSKTKYDFIYSLDVLEHISKKQENLFMSSIKRNLSKSGTAIIGMPSLFFQKYSSIENKKSHINCKNYDDLKKFLNKHFKNVFIFSMTDEVLHTGYEKISPYFISICSNKK
jgi:hypothetical protein